MDSKAKEYNKAKMANKILMARFVPKEAERENDFHSSERKCRINFIRYRFGE
jgi:hypothetical protein